MGNIGVILLNPVYDPEVIEIGPDGTAIIVIAACVIIAVVAAILGIRAVRKRKRGDQSKPQ